VLLAAAAGLALIAAGVIFVATRDGGSTEMSGRFFVEPHAIAITRSGDVLVADVGLHQVVRVQSDGSTNVVAGSGTKGYSGDGGPASAGQLDAPWAVVQAPSGEIYIADHGTHVIHHITHGVIRRLRLHPPGDLEIDGIGMAADEKVLYVSSRNRVYSIGPDRIASRIAGSINGYSGDGGPARDARFHDSNGIALHPKDGSIYVADSANHRVRRIAADRTISTVAGDGSTQYSFDGDLATNAGLSYPADVAFDAAGNLYILETVSRAIRKVAPNRQITTVVDSHEAGFAGDGGPAKQARLGEGVEDFAVAPDGTIYVLDIGNRRLRRISPDGVVSTVR
jgi:sugar lactone lactonase YvrE